MSQQFNTISAVVNDCLSDIGEMGGHRFQQFLGWAYRGLQEIFLDAGKQVRVAKLELSAIKTAQLPPGFIDWVKVSFQEGGHVRIMERATRHITSYALPVGGADFKLVGEISDCTPYFVIDEAAGTISFTSRVSTRPVYLEYITDGIADCCGDVVVHPYLLDYLRKYIKLTLAENTPKSTEAEIYRRGEDLHYAEKKARGRVLGMTMAELMAISK